MIICARQRAKNNTLKSGNIARASNSIREKQNQKNLPTIAHCVYVYSIQNFLSKHHRRRKQKRRESSTPAEQNFVFTVALPFQRYVFCQLNCHFVKLLSFNFGVFFSTSYFLLSFVYARVRASVRSDTLITKTRSPTLFSSRSSSETVFSSRFQFNKQVSKYFIAYYH